MISLSLILSAVTCERTRKLGLISSTILSPAPSLAHKSHFYRMNLLLLSHFSRVRPVRPNRQQPTRLPCPWDSPGKNTGVGCHFLLQCMKVKSESEVARSCPTLHDPMHCSLPGSSAHGIFQARVLEWGTISFSDRMNLGLCKSLHLGFNAQVEYFCSFCVRI